MALISISEAAEKWGISTSMLARLCRQGRIPQATKEKGTWMIPSDAEHPADGRVKSESLPVTGRLLPLPAGVSDFRKAASEYYYVDKTLLIRDFLDEVPAVSLFTRPGRFGKTLNLDMLRTFFEKTEEDTSRFFSDKKIWACGDYYRAQQGKYPVIFLSFKDARCATWQETFELISMMIRIEFRRHMELSNPLNSEFDYYENIVQNKAEPRDYGVSLMMLSKMLHDFHGIEPVILIDEYDTPIQQGYSNGFYDEAVLFFRNLFSGAFKDNRHLKYGFLTGTMRVAKESVFSGLNNVKINSVQDEQYSEYFGFTRNEAADMAAYYGAQDKLDDICAWYGGYRCGEKELLNPWSVISFLGNGCKPGCYGGSSCSNEVIENMLRNADEQTRKNLYALSQGKSVSVAFEPGEIYPRLQKDTSVLYRFLLAYGYITAEASGFSDAGIPLYKLFLPDKEISLLFEKEILSVLPLPGSRAVSIHEAICEGNMVD